MKDKLKIKEEWRFRNTTLLKIKRYGYVDTYWFLDNDKCIYKSSTSNNWRGMKSLYGEKIKTFRSEHKAVKWLLEK